MKNLRNILLTLTLVMGSSIYSAHASDMTDTVKISKKTIQKKAIDEAIAEIDKNIATLEKEIENEKDEAVIEAKKSAIATLKTVRIELERSIAKGDLDTSKDKRVSISDNEITIRLKPHDEDTVNMPQQHKNRTVQTSWLQLDLGINVFPEKQMVEPTKYAALTDLNNLKSVNATVHIITQAVNIVKNKLYFTYGIAIDHHDYRYNNNIVLQPKKDSVSFTYSPYPLKKNKLAVDYLTVPVMLHFETKPFKPSKSFKFGVGGYGGILVNSYTKQVSEQEGKKRFHDDFNLNRTNYGVAIQAGYGDLQLYTHVALAPLFDKTMTDQLMPVTFGVVINGFHWN